MLSYSVLKTSKLALGKSTESWCKKDHFAKIADKWTKGQFSLLIGNFATIPNPSFFSGARHCLPLPHFVRNAVATWLSTPTHTL